MTTENEASGFWSYVHKDNEQTGERISRLAQLIRDEFSLLTGEDLEIFVDREALSWGDEWRKRIDSALQETTFFVPIVTPRYFGSEECRRELLKFATHARSLGADDLLLPILFIPVSDLTETSADEAKALIAKTQYVDWTDLRLTEERSEEYARAVNRLALRLADIAESYSARPSVVTIAAPGQAEEGPGGDEPGINDLIAELEQGLPDWTATLESLSGVMEEIQEPVAHSTTRFESEADTFAKRVLIARDLAAELAGPADRLEHYGESYSSLLLQMDPGVRALIALAAEQDGEEEIRSACEMFRSLRSLIHVSQENESSMKQFISSLRQPARLFRDLRPAMTKMESGMRSALDAQTVMSEWARLMDESPLDCSAAGTAS